MAESCLFSSACRTSLVSSACLFIQPSCATIASQQLRLYFIKTKLTMKYTLKCVSKTGARRGILSGIERLPGFEMETPNVLLYTQGGLVPHLTPDVLQLLAPAPQAVMLPVPSIARIQGRMKETSMNVAQFIGLPHLMNVVTTVDPGRPRLEGFHRKDILAVQTRAGKKEYTPDSYMDFIESMEPDFFMTLCDGDTKKDSSSKRIEKSCSRSQNMTARCAARWQGSDILRRSAMLVPLEGGTEPTVRRAFAASVAHYGAAGDAGVVVDGLGQQGEEVASRNVGDYEDCIRASLENCGISGVRILPGAWHFTALFHLLELGIDLFDTSYPTIVTDRGGALLLPIHKDEGQPPTKRGNPPNFEISLKDERNAESFEPVSATCKCHCCKNHTRAYIYHLLNVNEMLATVLLNIHNLQQYLELFAAIRHSLDSDTFLQLKDAFR